MPTDLLCPAWSCHFFHTVPATPTFPRTQTLDPGQIRSWPPSSPVLASVQHLFLGPWRWSSYYHPGLWYLTVFLLQLVPCTRLSQFSFQHLNTLGWPLPMTLNRAKSQSSAWHVDPRWSGVIHISFWPHFSLLRNALAVLWVSLNYFHIWGHNDLLLCLPAFAVLFSLP